MISINNLNLVNANLLKFFFCYNFICLLLSVIFLGSYNISHLEQWLREYHLQESGAFSTMEPLIQASQLLQARKTDADVDSVCQMCPKLKTAQVCTFPLLFKKCGKFNFNWNFLMFWKAFCCKMTSKKYWWNIKFMLILFILYVIYTVICIRWSSIIY